MIVFFALMSIVSSVTLAYGLLSSMFLDDDIEDDNFFVVKIYEDGDYVCSRDKMDKGKGQETKDIFRIGCCWGVIGFYLQSQNYMKTKMKIDNLQQLQQESPQSPQSEPEPIIKDVKISRDFLKRQLSEVLHRRIETIKLLEDQHRRMVLNKELHKEICAFNFKYDDYVFLEL